MYTCDRTTSIEVEWNIGKDWRPRSDAKECPPVLQISAVGNLYDCKYMSDCRSRGSEFNPDPVPYFHVY